MTIYVDDAIWKWQGLKWCHMLADDIDELHGFASRLGIFRTSYQGPPKTSAPHYDVTGFERARAIALGAKPCSREEIVAVFRVVRVPRGSDIRRHHLMPAPVANATTLSPPERKAGLSMRRFG
jgi:hypothetical protein